MLQRAAELDTPALEDHDRLEEQVVRDAAREVGLSEAAVGQAVAEWRAGALAPLPPLTPAVRLGLPGTVVVERTVPLPPGHTGALLEQWLREQWFERRRARGAESEWAPRTGVLAGARRAATGLAGRRRLDGVGRLQLCVAPAALAPSAATASTAATATRVRLVADLGGVRRGLITGLVATPGVLVGSAVAVAIAAPAGAALPEVLLAVPAAAGAGGLGWLGARTALDSRRTALAEELEGLLDVLGSPRDRPPLPARAAAWALQRLPPSLR